jgi:eukaryotic-like serine/threonine-protein kinase
MNNESSVFDAEPEDLDHLFSQIMEGPDGAEDANSGAVVEAALEQLGTNIGPYKLVSVLGEGGMGMVYLAEQQGAIRRRVALKVVKPGMDSARVIARFESERQALALLDHPNIAQVYDAGTTARGRPYFVMEYVRGLSITEYCDRHRLSIDQRLRLFQQVCRAVHHAHQKGIIHRDIKPSNILVSAEADRAQPKIIDFGVAKAISQPLTEHTLFTEDSQLLGTPEYMSPEQAEMINEDIDTRSDIYSLGVLLYVLLTGVLPFDSKELRESGIEHIRQIIREADPKTPSTRLTKLGAEAGAIAEKRRTQIHALARHLRKELEWIPLKAMRKERAERYGSASELAHDIENYLEGAPLLAGPPSAGYRLRKFLRRHRALVCSIVVVLIVSVIGTAVSVISMLGQTRALAQADNALTEADRALAETDSIADYLYSDILSPISDYREDALTARDVLDIAAMNLEYRFKDHPLTEAKIRKSLASAYRYGIQDNEAAALQLEHARRIMLQAHGDPNKLPLNSLNQVYYEQGRYREAAAVGARKLELVRSRQPKPGDKWAYINLVGPYVELGRYEEAEQLVLETRSRFFPAEKGKPNMTLGGIYFAQGRYEEAESEFRAFGETEGGPWHSVGGRISLARLDMEQARYADANELLVTAIEIGQRELELGGRTYIRLTLDAVNSLGVLRTRQGQGHFDEAEQLFEEVLNGRREKFDEDHPWILQTINDLGVLRREQGQHEQAEKLLTQALEGRRKKLGTDVPAYFESEHELGLLYLATKDYPRAAPLLLNAYNGRKTMIGPDHAHTLQSAHALGVLYMAKTKYKEAESKLQEAYHGRKAKLRPGHPHTIESLKQLIKLYEVWGKADEAKTWQEKLSALSDQPSATNETTDN